ncbi:uncharacterized protein FPRN_01946 [Fusarium proliferatum]|nr:uncharacterized protein FPRN_01946 [Fusarium proliferatum]
MYNISINAYIREAEHRFLLWASFLGVHADDQQCLDNHLRHSPEMRELILLMLRVLRRNLVHVLAESPEIQADNQKGPVYGIDGALDRLHRLAAVIRNAQIIDETRDIDRLDIKWIFDSFGMSIVALIQKNFPEAPLSLQQQLSRSVIYRTKRLIHGKQTLAVLKTHNLNNQASKSNCEVNAGMVDLLDTNFYPFESYFGAYKNPGEMGSTAYWETPRPLDLYPNAPFLDEGHQEVLCRLCSTPINHSIIESKEAWKNHIDHDLRPYVCVSEECEQPQFLFPTVKDWRSHMEVFHGLEWPQYVHRSRWTCPYCEPVSESTVFTSAEDFSRHLSEGDTHMHWFSPGSIDLYKLTIECKQYDPISKRDCPLCRAYKKSDNSSVVFEGYDEDQDFYEHFTRHLRFVAFEAFSLWDTHTGIEQYRLTFTDNDENMPSASSDDETESNQVKSSILNESPSRSEWRYPDYRLQKHVFQHWLREKFNDPSIEVHDEKGEYIFRLPDNRKITKDDKTEIDELRI